MGGPARDRAPALAGTAFQRLVPATVLPPEDPARATAVRRTFRDWFVDALLFLIALGFGALFFAANGGIDHHAATRPPTPLPVDVVLGVLASVLLWARRRWPVTVAVVSAAFSIVSAWAAPASVIALFGVAVHRRTTVAVAVAAVNLATSAGYSALSTGDRSFAFDMAVSLGAAAIVTAWGMFVRARRQLVWTLRERAERAEADQRLHAEQARAAERARIAREMHDVLGHRISLLALHAGGLQLRPDLPPDRVEQTAALLRETAQQALHELRGVIGVLREGAEGDAVPAVPAVPAAPQPTLSDIARLVADTRSTGTRIDFRMSVDAMDDAPGPLGRDAYRVVQEALTNVSKHAHGTATTVQVTGGPGAGLRVLVRNRLPIAAGSVLPGSGTGLLGLRERVSLAGGSLEHGPADGDFVVEARLSW